ncbi:MAG: PAS domain S-box protein [Rhodospirillales bacterium]|nr:PAS domain S-box protein [Rhodospirillales bacterium]
MLSPPFSALRPSRLVTILAAFLTGLLLLGGVGLVWERYVAALDAARRDTARLASELGRETARLLQTADLVLRDLAERGAATDQGTFPGAMGTKDLRALLADRISALPQLEAIAVVASDGKLVNSYGRWPATETNVAERAYFQRLKAGGAAEPLLEAAAGGPGRTLLLARKAAGANGSFLGIVVGAIDLRYLGERLKAAVSGESGAIALLEADGHLLLSEPPPAEREAGASGAPTIASLDGRDAVTFEGSGDARVVSVRAVESFPLLVTAALSQGEIAAAWLGGAAPIAGVFGLAIGCLLYGRLRLVRQMRRRERLDALLVDSAVEYRSVVDKLETVVFQTDADGRWTFLSPAWAEIMGYPVDESLGRPFLAYVHPDDRALEVERFQPLVSREKEHCRHEVRYVARDGSIRWIEVSARLTLDAEGEATGTAGTLDDVTERHAAIEALRASEARQRAIVDAAPLAVLTIDAEGRIAGLNAAAEAMFGCRSDAAIGQDAARFVALPEGDPAEHLSDDLAPDRSAGPERWLETEATRADGSRFPCELALTPITIEGKTFFVAHLRDLASRVTAEREMRAAKEAAEAAIRARQEFLDTLSREIRSSAEGVIAMAELVAEKAPKGEPQQSLSALRKSAGRLRDLVDVALDLSELDAGRFELEETPFDLGELIRHVAFLLEERAAEKGLALGYELDPEMPDRLIGDPRRLRQILLSLAGNAVEATDEGGVEIRAYRLPTGSADRVAVALEIADTGTVVPPEALPNLFDGSHGAGHSGRRGGLGLALAHRLVGAMGGEIAVKGEPGERTIVTVTLGLQVAPDPAVEPEDGSETLSEPLGAGERSPRILLAEDNPINQRVAVALLEALGCSVDVVGDGREALEAVQRGAYDAVLMDMMMPGMDGLEATRAIRALDEERAGVPVIALTANAFAEDRAACEAAGMSGFVTKPVTAATLHEALAAVLSAQSAAPAEAPRFDESALAELRRTYGAAAPRFAGLFLKESLTRLQRIEDSLRRGDRKQVALEAHTLKGSAVTFGCRALSEAAGSLEAAAKDEAADLIPHVEALSRAFDEVREGLEMRLRSAA